MSLIVIAASLSKLSGKMYIHYMLPVFFLTAVNVQQLTYGCFGSLGYGTSGAKPFGAAGHVCS